MLIASSSPNWAALERTSTAEPLFTSILAAASLALIAPTSARVFCRRLDAELVAIDGVYQTADDMDSRLRGHAVQAGLDGDVMRMAALD